MRAQTVLQKLLGHLTEQAMQQPWPQAPVIWMQLYQGIAYCQVAICTFLVAIDLPVVILRIHSLCQTCIPVLKELVPASRGCDTKNSKNQQAQSLYTFTAPMDMLNTKPSWATYAVVS